MTARPVTRRPPSVAIVGAGMSGLACARALAASGWTVRLFEKSRGPGGRAATRRGDAGPYDHGAQYFTVREAAFAQAVARWQAAGVLAPWPARIVHLDRSGRPARAAEPDRTGRQVGLPGMSSLGRHLADGLDVAYGHTVCGTQREAGGWRLAVVAAAGAAPRTLPERWDWLVCSAPAPQTASLLAPLPTLAAAAAARTMQPCWATMVDFAENPDTGWDAAFVDDDVLAWAAREASRPGRPAGGRWVLHASVAWSVRHLEASSATVAASMVEAFARVAGVRALPRAAVAHRWRYARPDPALPMLPDRCLLDPIGRAGACGDWTSSGRMEEAWLSGIALAQKLSALDTGVM